MDNKNNNTTIVIETVVIKLIIIEIIKIVMIAIMISHNDNRNKNNSTF